MYEPDEKHAGVIIQTMGVENGKSVATPALTERAEDVQDREESAELSPTETTSYRALAARVSYLSADRPDIQFTSKSLCKFMSKPRQFDWVGMKRLARYLLRAKRSRQTFAWQPRITEVTTFTDSDWGGDRRTRKSTSGGIMQLGKHVVKSWSTSQKNIALSSGEAELYALTKGACETKGLVSLMTDLGYSLNARVCSDATAAIAIASRKGLGRTRHIDVQCLWIQSEIEQQKLKLTKVNTHYNPADVLTKALSQDTMLRHLTAMLITVDSEEGARASRTQCRRRKTNKKKGDSPL